MPAIAKKPTREPSPRDMLSGHGLEDGAGASGDVYVVPSAKCAESTVQITEPSLGTGRAEKTISLPLSRNVVFVVAPGANVPASGMAMRDALPKSI